MLFRSTPPRGERHSSGPYSSGTPKSFRSTPPRGERRSALSAQMPLKGVSIHAPARGATSSIKRAKSSWPVSIHAPARGATRRPAPRRSAPGGFDPRPRAGSDNGAPVDWRVREVSIHAPARGATLRQEHMQTGYRVSIHAPARGATRRRACRGRGRGRFDPRPRAGSDKCWESEYNHLIGFDPRPRAGSDGRLPQLLCGDDVSIHAPARGATTDCQRINSRPYSFDPRPRAGSDRRRSRDLRALGMFRSTPPRGERHIPLL